jgi:hypothetical protein
MIAALNCMKTKTKSTVKCTFCGEPILVGEQCERWIGFTCEMLITGPESAHIECSSANKGLEEWERGSFLRGSAYPRPAESPPELGHPQPEGPSPY